MAHVNNDDMKTLRAVEKAARENGVFETASERYVRVDDNGAPIGAPISLHDLIQMNTSQRYKTMIEWPLTRLINLFDMREARKTKARAEDRARKLALARNKRK